MILIIICLVDLGQFLRTDISNFREIKFPYIYADPKISNNFLKTFYDKNKFTVGISWTSINKEMRKIKILT